MDQMKPPGSTLLGRMALARGHTQGFDYLRILLAISIVLWHTVVTCYGFAAQETGWSGWRRPFVGPDPADVLRAQRLPGGREPRNGAGR